MRARKTETFIYEGLGFPILMVNVPMKKVLGEWAMDIDFNALQRKVLKKLASKPTTLTGAEIKFIIDYLELSTRNFAKLFGVTHAAVLKWEQEKTRMNPGTEACVRLHILNYLKATDKEFRKIYSRISPENLARSSGESSPLEIDALKIAC